MSILVVVDFHAPRRHMQCHQNSTEGLSNFSNKSNNDSFHTKQGALSQWVGSSGEGSDRRLEPQSTDLLFALPFLEAPIFCHPSFLTFYESSRQLWHAKKRNWQKGKDHGGNSCCAFIITTRTTFHVIDNCVDAR